MATGNQRQAGERSTNFAVACSLLSQYVKENGFPSRPLDAPKVPVTMDLLRSIDDENKTEGECEVKGNTLQLFPQGPAAVQEETIETTSEARKQENSQLTIIYGGKVLVFDEVSSEKAKDLMQFASNTASAAQNFAYVAPSVVSKGQPTFPDLPLTRKASLQRFFDMRKNRINSRAPYSLVGSAKKANPVKSEESATWLGLVNPQLSKSNSFSLSSDCGK